MIKPRLKTVAVLCVVSGLLAGCAVYGPPPVYGETVTYQPAPVYVQPRAGYYYEPAPVYVEPAPVYAAPPVSFGFSFGYWGGHGRHHR